MRTTSGTLADVDETLNVLGLAERTHELLMPRAAARWPKDRPRPTLTVFELLIDGTPFLDMVHARRPGYSLRSPLWVGYPRILQSHARALLGEAPSDLAADDPPDHVALLMCPSCGTGGCGVLSARLLRRSGRVQWTDIGRQVPDLGDLGTLTFDADQYAATLRPLAELLPCGD